MQDSFDIGSPPSVGNDPADPYDGSWFRGGDAGSLSIVNESGNNVLRLDGSNSYDVAVSNFATQNLSSVGDSIEFSVRVRSETAINAVAGIRVALSDTVSPGGYVFIANWGNGTNDGVFEANGAGAGTTSKWVDGGDNFQLSGTVFYTLTGKVRRSGTDQVTFTFGRDGTDYIDSATFTDATPTFSFNRISIGDGSIAVADQPHSFRIDDVSVRFTAVPEPTTLLSIGLFLGSLLFGRKRRSLL